MLGQSRASSWPKVLRSLTSDLSVGSIPSGDNKEDASMLDSFPVRCPYCKFLYRYSDDAVEQFMDWGGMGFRGITCRNEDCQETFVVCIDDNNGVAVYALGADAQDKTLPHQVPEKYRKEFDEARLVLPISPRASAALSRRLLEYFLTDHTNKRGLKLGQLIDRLQNTEALPTDLNEAIDLVRQIGNFAAHANKDWHTGEIIEVAPREAQLLLDILEGLFRFYFVWPYRIRQQQEETARKDAARKPPQQ